jgi:hypothetical protein
MTFSRKGQSMLEYTILFIIIVAALMTMQLYMKRGLQGRWKSTTDDLGEQYDPYKMNSTTIFNSTSSGATHISAEPSTNGEGYVTMRRDSITSSERRTGMTRIEN